MKRKIESLLALFFYGGIAIAQNPAHSIIQDIKNSEVKDKGVLAIEATSYRLVKIDVPQLRRHLKNVSTLNTHGISTDVFIDLPLPDGSIHSYSVLQNNTMSPELAEKYPLIKAYNGYGITKKDEYVKFDINPQGLHAMILSPGKPAVFIDPAFKGDSKYYMVYKTTDFKTTKKLHCGVKSNPSLSTFSYYNKYKNFTNFSTCFLRTYKLALAATSQYTAYFGGVSQAIAAQITTINRVNGVYETDLGVTLDLIGNNNNIVFTTPYPPGVTPYTSGDGVAMLTQNQNNIDFVIGNSNYDIGHVFDQSNPGSAIANLGTVCFAPEKAQGVTSHPAPVGDPFDIDYVAHEMGHQFGANHIQNNACQRNDPTAVEPGSGSTIMGYAGVCAPNIQNNSNAYFNGINLQEIGDYVTAFGTCSVNTAILAGAPVVAPLSNITIPASTPFALTAIATGTNSSNFTYGWEQQDNQITVQPPVSTATGGPNFRSLPPQLQATRFFPNLNALANNGPFTWEVLSSVNRTMDFRVSVRANTANGSCNAYQDMTVTINAAAGPFLLIYPNVPNILWNGGTQEAVLWDVANTNLAPISETNVDILLSVDGGLTYPYTLVSNVLNNGTYAITVPSLNTTTARVMVRAHSGKFFAISSNIFTIVSSGSTTTPPAIDNNRVIRDPLNKSKAFVYYSSLGDITVNDQMTVNGIPEAVVTIDTLRQRFIIGPITNPRKIPNVSISFLHNNSSVISNTFTIPAIL